VWVWVCAGVCVCVCVCVRVCAGVSHLCCNTDVLVSSSLCARPLVSWVKLTLTCGLLAVGGIYGVRHRHALRAKAAHGLEAASNFGREHILLPASWVGLCVCAHGCRCTRL